MEGRVAPEELEDAVADLASEIRAGRATNVLTAGGDRLSDLRHIETLRRSWASSVRNDLARRWADAMEQLKAERGAIERIQEIDLSIDANRQLEWLTVELDRRLVELRAGTFAFGVVDGLVAEGLRRHGRVARRILREGQS